MSSETITLDQQIACVRRELALRKSAYPRWIQSRRMTQATADKEIAAMEAVLATLLSLAAQVTTQLQEVTL